MVNTYAIIDEAGGWLVNVVLWNGDINVWQPPVGTIAKLIDEVDLDSLPQAPEILQ